MCTYNSIDRRYFLQAATASAAALSPASLIGSNTPKFSPKKVSAVATVYRRGSHADVILGKILEGWRQDSGPGPALELASLYVEQIGDDDLSENLCERHSIPMFDSIEQAVTCGTNGVPVDGVISIAEHGDYPWNQRAQHLYPRRRFFQEITDVLARHDRRIPVFNDKHPGPEWEDSLWMYQRSKQLKLPFMAGSSLPVSYRTPAMPIPLNAKIEAAVGIGYDGLDIYGSHALDSLQSIIERRRRVNTGVRWVQLLEGDAVDRVFSKGLVSYELFTAALDVVPKVQGNISPVIAPQRSVILFECEDGFLGAQFMLQSVNRTSVAVKLEGQRTPVATQFEERTEPRHPHFAYLTKAIERMMHTGKPAYPVERAVLTSGILDRAIRSWHEKGKRIYTPELSIQYKPIDYPHAPLPSLTSDPNIPIRHLFK